MPDALKRFTSVGPRLRLLFNLLAALPVVAYPVPAWPQAQAYLPRIGPSPVRFVSPLPPMVMVMLPPLKSEDPATNDVAVTSGPAKAAAAPNKPPKGTAPGLQPASKSATTNAPPAVVPPKPNDSDDVSTPLEGLEDQRSSQNVIPPQKLVNFFRIPGTNGASDIHIAVPVEFQPPPPLTPPSSTATFNSK